MNVLAHFVVFINVLRFTSSRFEHLVKPSCKQVDEVCEFHFNIHYMETMVYYRFDKDVGVPVVYRNGTFYKRSTSSCDGFKKLSKQELQDIVTVDGSSKMIFSVNGQFPGPPVVVYEGQTVAINVVNNLINEGLTIHWHGMTQKHTPWMDGVSMLTQCPIQTKQTFQYRFQADPSGTHWYHSHHGTQRTDGIAGPLIVLPKPENERSDIPAVDRDFIVMLQDWIRNTSALEVNMLQYWRMKMYSNERNSSTCFFRTHTIDGTGVGDIPFHSALINGRGHFYPDKDDVPEFPELPIETFHVKRDRYFRFRIINAGLVYSLKVSIDNHRLEVISSDGYDVVPLETESVIVADGERFDVVVKADAEIGNYWIRVETIATRTMLGAPRKPGQVLGILRYDGAPEHFPKSHRRKCTQRRPCTVVNCPFSQYPRNDHIRCIPLSNLKSTEALVQKYPVPTSKEGAIEEIFLNFHFAVSKKINSYRPAVNSHLFKTPSCPPQVSYEEKYESCIDDCNNHNCDEWCQCTHIIKLNNLNKPVQLVLVNNDDLQYGISHPVHIHGHGVHVVKVAYADTDEDSGVITGDNPDITCSGIDCRYAYWTNPDWSGGNIPDANIKNPLIKDTFIVPRKGYVVVRFLTDNPGYWFMHCHVEKHQLEGMTLVLQEGENYQMAPPPARFPSCGSFTWTEKEYKDHLKQYSKNDINHRPRSISSMLSTLSSTVNADNDTDLHNISSHDIIKHEDDLDKLAGVTLSRSVFLLVIVVFLLIFLLLITLFICLCRTRTDIEEYSVLQSSSDPNYGSFAIESVLK